MTDLLKPKEVYDIFGDPMMLFKDLVNMTKLQMVILKV
jgi:hypothetical protein